VGRALYESICFGCHAQNPLQDVRGVLGGADRPDNILNAVENVAQMRFLMGTIGPVQARDIAAYLAKP
jgi:mono/diheme cytochrome c family protein